jgi:hypothetical protein
MFPLSTRQPIKMTRLLMNMRIVKAAPEGVGKEEVGIWSNLGAKSNTVSNFLLNYSSIRSKT